MERTFSIGRICIWKSLFSVGVFALCFSISSFAQTDQDQIYISEQGIMYWGKDSSEVTGFGINYTVPFAHAYRSAKKLGVNLKAAIDQDVYQFERLGLDLFRVHVWDCEISDSAGNLLVNEHFDLFDYLLYRLNEKGIKSVITPIAYWGNGWPDPDEPTPGFSSKYGKDKCLVDTNAIKAQENYLSQFVNHINPYTGIAYKNDPFIIAFEVCNEPHHRGSPEEVTTFVQKMKDAIRVTGCTKPVFYNVTHSVHLAEAYFDAGIDGGTFQWYPTGLGYQRELKGNLLPNVDRYTIPFDDVLKKNHAARFVYEFDAADMASTYMYPAMARSFRTAGMQLATHFSYDPTFLAPYNTEYNTHFMNLIYAPRKALSLMICAEIFRSIPLYTDYGVYPENTSFGPFHISYKDDLAEMITDEKFIYTNHTTSKIKSPEQLKLIAGYGNSSLIEYDGTGAYFLDKVGDGIWQLELMPDAIVVDNLFGRNNLQTKRAVVNYERRPMKINLPGFEEGFSVESIDWRDSIVYREIREDIVELVPGKYLLMSPKHSQKDYVELTSKRKLEFDSLYLLPAELDSVYVYHEKTTPWLMGKDHKLKAVVAAPEKPKEVMIRFLQSEKQISQTIPMVEKKPYHYEGVVPGKFVAKGPNLVYQYHFAVHFDSTFFYNPANKMFDEELPIVSTGHHGQWLDHDRSEDPYYLLQTSRHFPRLNMRWLPSFAWPDGKRRYDSLHIKLDRLTIKDPENLHGELIGDYSLRHYFGDIIEGRRLEMKEKEVLVLEAAASEGRTIPIQVSLVLDDGTAFGYTFEVNDNDQLYYVLLADLEPFVPVLLPRPYPTFLPYYSSVKPGGELDLMKAESLQISIGPGIPKTDWNRMFDVRIRGVWLE